MKAQSLTLALAFTLTACGGNSPSPTQSSPIASTTSTTPAATSIAAAAADVSVSAPVTYWKVTQSFVSVSGPDNCWVREQRALWTGVVFPGLPMSVTRSNGSIALQSSFFQVNYEGTFTGTAFSATGVQPLEGGGRPCKDGTSFQQMPGQSNLSGTFSADDQTVTANEVNSYRLTSGEPVVYTWAWRATRQN